MANLAELEFEWDEANEEKLLLRHDVRADEVEQLFQRAPQVRRSGDDYLAIGQTDSGRWLLVVFVIRVGRIRPYSAQDLSPGEKQRFRR